MLWIDIIIFMIFMGYTLAGTIRGFIHELLSLSILMIAVWVGLTFSREFSMLLSITLKHPAVRAAFSFTGLLLITVFIGRNIQLLLAELINKDIGFINRLCGMILGCLHGTLVIAVAIMLAGLTPLPKEPWWDASVSISPFQLLAISLAKSTQSEMATYISF